MLKILFTSFLSNSNQLVTEKNIAWIMNTGNICTILFNTPRYFKFLQNIGFQHIRKIL